MSFRGGVEKMNLTLYETASSANSTRENEPGLHMSETWVNRRLSLGPFDPLWRLACATPLTIQSDRTRSDTDAHPHR